MCNPREEGDSSDDACASVFVHKDDDIANNQCVRVELIEVSNDYFNQEENLNLPSEVQSNAHFRLMDKVDGGKKVGCEKEGPLVVKEVVFGTEVIHSHEGK